MINRTKYIIFDSGLNDEIVIFSDMQEHAHIARGLGMIVSAGFISIGFNEDGQLDASCFGKSVSLDVESRPEIDSKIARKALGFDQ